MSTSQPTPWSVSAAATDTRRISCVLTWTALTLLSCVGAALMSVHLGVDTNYDLKNYHIYNPFGASRFAYDVAPAGLQTFFNPVGDWPLQFLLRHFNESPRFIAACLGAQHGLNFALLAAVCWEALALRLAGRFSRLVAAGLAVFIGATAAGSGPLVGTSTGDLTVATPLLGAVYAVLRAVRPGSKAGHKSAWLLGAGVATGLAFGLKASSGPLCVALALGVCWAIAPRMRAMVSFVLAAVLGFSLAGGAHALKMWRLYQNPYFPLFNGLFKSPYVPPISMRDTRFLPRSWQDAFLYPYYWARDWPAAVGAELRFRDPRFLAALLAFLLAGGVWWARRWRARGAVRLSPPARLMVAFFCLGYALWITVFGIYRYIMPLELLTGLAIVMALTYVWRGVTSLVAACAVAGLCVSLTVPLDWGHVPFGKKYVDVDTSALPAGSVVIIVDAPAAYLAPFSDASIRWLKVDDLVAPAAETSPLGRQQRALLAAHTGDVYLLAAPSGAARAAGILDFFQLVRREAPCISVPTNLERTPHQLCPLSRTGTPTGLRASP
jgi:hypothetical protein